MTELKKQVKIKILTSKVIKSPWANGYCKKYFLELNYNNKKFSFPFTDSVAAYCKNEKLDKINALYCVLSDADAYDSTQNIDDFAAEFGYEKVSELLKAYRACEKTSEKMHEIFTDAELEQLHDEFQDY